MKCLSPCLCMATVPHIMVRLERMLDYRGVRLARSHCSYILSSDLWYMAHVHTVGCTKTLPWYIQLSLDK